MTFVRETWADNSLPAVVGSELNRIEQGIVDAHAGLADQDPDLIGLQHGVTKGGSVSWVNATTLSVAAGKGWIKQASGLLRPVSWAATNLTIPVPASGLRRIDQAVVDSTGAVSRLAGTAEGAAYSLDGRENAGNLPVGSMRLADAITVQADGGMLSTANNIRDRRQWGRGAFNWQRMTSDGGYTNIPVAGQEIVPLRMRSEFSGDYPVAIRMRLSFSQNNDLGGIIWPIIDGTGTDGSAGFSRSFEGGGTILGNRYFYYDAEILVKQVTQGSHVIGLMAANASGTGTMALYYQGAAGGGPPIQPMMTVREIMQKVTANGAP